MGQSTEDYLDSLLRQAMGIEEPKPDTNENIDIADEAAGNSMQSVVDVFEDISLNADLLAANVEGNSRVEDTIDSINDIQVDEVEPSVDLTAEVASEPAVTMSIDDLDPADANKALDPDMIAALFAGANAEDNSQAEEAVDTTEEIQSVDEPAPEPVKTMSIDDLDPADANKALDPDMIAALFAGSNVEESSQDDEAAMLSDGLADDGITTAAEDTSATENSEEADLVALLDNLDNLDSMIEESAQDTNDDGVIDFNGMDLGDVDLGAMLDDVTKSVDEERLENTEDMSAEDLNALLNSLDSDEDISDIGNMLSKDENEELLDPGSMNALLNSDEDLVPSFDEEEEGEEGKGKKKKKKKDKKEKKKLFGKKKKSTDDFEGLGADGEEIALDIDLDSLPDISEEKKSFLSKVIEKLFEEDEEEEAVAPSKGNVYEESAVDIATEGAVANEEILKQLEEEPEEDKKKKKKGKKKKGGDDEEGEDSKSKKKKKEKKQKEEEPELPQKKLPLKKVLANIGLILSVAAVFIVLAYFFPYAHDKQMAKKYYITGDYKEVYEHLRGHKLSEEEQLIYEQAFTVLKVDRQYDSYEKYMKLGFKLEALNALVQGVQVMDDYSTRASELGIIDKFEPICQKIVDALNNVFGVSVDTARAWYQLEGTDEYTRSLYNHLYNMMPRDEQGNLIYYPEEANREIMTVEETNL